jgi:hypothetical protein
MSHSDRKYVLDRAARVDESQKPAAPLVHCPFATIVIAWLPSTTSLLVVQSGTLGTPSNRSARRLLRNGGGSTATNVDAESCIGMRRASPSECVSIRLLLPRDVTRAAARSRTTGLPQTRSGASARPARSQRRRGARPDRPRIVLRGDDRRCRRGTSVASTSSSASESEAAPSARVRQRSRALPTLHCHR